MKLLLDTAKFLWAISEPTRLPPAVRSAMLAPKNRLLLSVASIWEASVKFGLGKLPLPDDPDRYLPSQRDAVGIESLPISETAAGQVHRLTMSTFTQA
ncbi:MAG: type II toxin-antitoxin system VapC family toxin [Myxococcota bacterium]